MSPVTRVQGLTEALRGLDSASMARLGSELVGLFAHEARIRMATYAPETEANHPRPYPQRWYQRLWGPRWYNAGGGLGGKNTSEQLQYAWRQTVITPLTQEVAPIAGARGGPVSYAHLVQDPEEQTAVHKRHGWQTTEDVARQLEEDPEIELRVMAAVDAALL